MMFFLFVEVDVERLRLLLIEIYQRLKGVTSLAGQGLDHETILIYVFEHNSSCYLLLFNKKEKRSFS